MKISNISINPDCEDENAIASASLVIDDCVFINGIRIIDSDCVNVKLPFALEVDGVCFGKFGLVSQENLDFLARAVRTAYGIYTGTQKRIAELVIKD